MSRHDRTDEQWEAVRCVLPLAAPIGRPPIDRRAILNGILFVLKTGCP